MEKFPPVIELNVGGTIITTSLSTLTKEPESMLAVMFSGRDIVRDKDGRYFIDSNGRVFSYIIDFLRDGTVPPKNETLCVYNAAVHFGIKSLQQALEDAQPVKIQKKINAVKTGTCAKNYEQLKSETIRVLEKSYLYDITFIQIRYQNPSGGKCRRNGEYCTSDSYAQSVSFPDHLSLTYPEQVCVNFQPTKDLIWCLSQEMITLGYGNYVFEKLDNKICRDCRGSVDFVWKIMFSFHKMVQDEINKFTLAK